MNVEETIKQSRWWGLARDMPDRHYPPDAGVSLADHLERVLENLCFLDGTGHDDGYFPQLVQTLLAMGLDPGVIAETLTPVALLHDIGKTQDDKSAEIAHPITGKTVKKRHPVVGVCAALELLPESLLNRDTILTLVEEHDTPYSWYVQHQRSGQIPKRKSWARLDRKIDPREDGTGLILLAVFKLADVDGHENVDDVSWFLDQCNHNHLSELGRTLPVPARDVIKGML